MVTNENFKFQTSISLDAYTNKEISNAMIGSSKNAENRRIRKEYGFKANKGIGYVVSEETPSTLLDKMTSGYVMCNLFYYNTTRKDGTFGSYEKKDMNFGGAYTIGVDIDQTEYSSAEEFVDRLTHKPTFYYTSYSNLQEGKGARFRLIYVFDSKIEDKYYYRYCAWKINKQIENDTNEEIKDDCNLKCTQYFNGTNRNNNGLNVSYGITNYIYSESDFGINLVGYREFLSNNGYYKTYDRKRNREFISIIKEIDTNNSITSSSVNDRMENDTYERDRGAESSNENDSIFNERLLADYDRLSETEFKSTRDWVKCLQSIKYIYRVEKEEWINGSYQFVDNDYFCLFWNAEKVMDGSKRRKGLFQRMCLRKFMCPNITAMELVFSTIVDIFRFYDNTDGLLNAEFIRRNVSHCIEMTTEEIKESYYGEIEYLRTTTKPKRGIIYKSKKAHSRETTFCILDDFYNVALSVQDNYYIINNVLGYRIGKSYLYEYLKDRGITYRLTDKALVEMTDWNLTASDNFKKLKANGFNVGNKRYYKIYRENKGKCTTK